MSGLTLFFGVIADTLLGLGISEYRASARSLASRSSSQSGSAALFRMLADGFPRCLWVNVFSSGRHHRGIDVFNGEGIGPTLFVAANLGYITRPPG